MPQQPMSDSHIEMLLKRAEKQQKRKAELYGDLASSPKLPNTGAPREKFTIDRGTMMAQPLEEHEEFHGGSWKIALADLMTVLMAFFLVLWLSAYGQKEEGNEANDKTPPPIPALSQDLLSSLSMLTETPPKVTLEKITDGRVKINLDGVNYFESGSSQLKYRAQYKLRMIARTLNKYAHEIKKIEIIGHTDNVQIYNERYPSNWYLSSARAIVVGEYFMREQNISPQIVFPIGRSSMEPIADNQTQAGRQANRRVEIIVDSQNLNHTQNATPTSAP